MNPDEINELRAKSAALAAHGCVTSRRILWLLDKHDQQSYSGDCIRIVVDDALAAEAKCRAKDAVIMVLSDKLRICSETIVSLAERCAGQSELLGRRAEQRVLLVDEMDSAALLEAIIHGNPS